MPKLTVLKVKNAGPGVYGDGEGLYLRVKPTGARSWVLRVQHDKKREDIGLGSLADLSLEEARQKARQLRKVARQGKSARAERDRDRVRAPTFAEAMIKAHAELSKGWATRTGKSFKSSLEEHAVPKLGEMHVDVIGAAEIILAVAPIWATKPSMTRVVRHYIMKVLAFSKARGWRTDALPDPRELRSGLSKQAAGGNFAAMRYAEVPAFFAAELAKGITASRAGLLFTILTGARSGEVCQATWEQVDLDARTWSRPTKAMKMRLPHVVTLSEAAINLLVKIAPEGMRKGPIFVGRRGGQLSNMAMTKVLRRAVTTETLHGFRSSFRDWAAEQMTTIPAMVAEMALAHKVGTSTEQAYLRSDLRDMRRALMDAWGRFVAPALSGTGDNVVSLDAAKRSA